MEVETGIAPVYTVLQTAASLLGHTTMVAPQTFTYGAVYHVDNEGFEPSILVCNTSVFPLTLIAHAPRFFTIIR